MAYSERANELISDFNCNALMGDDVNVTLSNWSQKFLSIMNVCVPKQTLPKRKNLPRLMGKLISLMRKRNSLHSRGKASGDLSKYRSLRNKITLELHKAKKTFSEE